MENNAGRIGVVVSSYNSNITDRLQDGAIQTLNGAGYGGDRIPIRKVPGAWEIPLAARSLADEQDVLGVIALGAVIRGETTHDQYINHAVSTALMDLMMSSRKPVGFGLLTCNSLEQAIHRAGGNVGNKGIEAAQAVLDMLNLDRG